MKIEAIEEDGEIVIAITKEIAEQLKITDGDRLEQTVEGNEIVIRRL
jgi:bifunctional DNA-binding transcriptional regulator/antitoxin component of YhaV-PrlF toxin-antitoxin module